MPNNETRDDLVAELESDVNSVLRVGSWDNRFDLSLTTLGVLASLVATILVAQGQREMSPWIVASVAAIPAAATSLQRIIGIRERANWYFLYAARVSSLATQLRYSETPNLEEFANKYAAISEAMEEQWTTIGRSGAASTQHVARRKRV